MRRLLRLAAVAVAIAGFVDPAVARRVRAPLSIAIQMPPASDPDFGRAEALKGEIIAALENHAVVGGPAAPHAIVAIGNARLPPATSAPVFAVPVPALRPSISIVDVSVPERTVPGQAAYVRAALRAHGLAGRRASVTLELRGSIIETVHHQCTRDDESFEARFSLVPPAAGVHRARVVVRMDGRDERPAADTVLVTRAQPVRVLAFEARPSWPVAFVRRSLEADDVFSVALTSRSSRPAATTTGGAPLSLDSLDVDRFDVVIVGALDELRDRDLSQLERFVSRRGGTLILLPDRRLPAPIRRRFNLPNTDEVLVETAVRVQSSAAVMRASELLLMPQSDGGFKPLAWVRHGGVDRPAIGVVDHGRGQVVLSGALDAWRYRAEESNGFDKLWRGLVADGALAAPPRVALSVTPAIARPGDEIDLSVALRDTELDPGGGVFSSPLVAAAISGGDGRRETIRLWPGTRAGVYTARLIAPAQGRYSVSAAVAGSSTEVPFLVADDVVAPARDESAALRHAARASGGAVLSGAGEAAAALAAIEPELAARTMRPMRSGWWIVPFTVLLCAEWALRRRSGLK